MTLTNYAYDGPEDDPKITVNNEDELIEWANLAFEPEGYEVWDMDIPPAVLGAPAPDIRRRLQKIDREITAVGDAGAATSQLTDALDDLWQHLDGRALVSRDLLTQAADELEDSARRLRDDAGELKSFPLEADAVEGYERHAGDLHDRARALRACADPESHDDDQEDAP